MPELSPREKLKLLLTLCPCPRFNSVGDIVLPGVGWVIHEDDMPCNLVGRRLGDEPESAILRAWEMAIKGIIVVNYNTNLERRLKWDGERFKPIPDYRVYGLLDDPSATKETPNA